jgi:sulfite oxidase
MEEPASGNRYAARSSAEDRALAEARDALLDAREALLAERERTADARDVVADDRDSTADARDVAADDRDRTADARDLAADQRQTSNEQLRAELERRSERLTELIAAADARDHLAEIRDRAAEARDAAGAVRAQRYRDDLRRDELDREQSAIDRIWAGENRDAAAADRTELRDMARDDPEDRKPDD